MVSVADYGSIGPQLSRFSVIGDLRRMLPVSSIGGIYDRSVVPTRKTSGGSYEYYTGISPVTTVALGGAANCLPNTTGIFSFGDYTAADGTAVAIRLGVTGTTGGNVTGFETVPITIMANNVLNGLTQRYTAMFYGEAAYQDTNATASQYGASVEQFLNNVAGTVSVANGGTAVTGVATTFTTAAIGGAAGPYTGIYNTNTASKNALAVGDVILITLDSGSKSFHRVAAIGGATTMTIYPAAPSAATGKAYSLWRSGWGSWSRVVSIINGGVIYNYYTGLAVGASIGGPIMCFTKNLSTGASSHFTSPQTTDTLGTTNVGDIGAVDIAYYKGFLVYGLNGSISWSKAGFPTNFTTAFGAADFPAANISVVDNQSTFVSFEYIGDQLIAIFRDSVWQIQATGTVPEFAFYRLPEAYGCLQVKLPSNTVQIVAATPIYSRPSLSGRNAAYYLSPGGLVKLAGGVGTIVSSEQNELLFSLSTNVGGMLMAWDQSTDSVWVGAPGSNTGLIYSAARNEWSYYNISAIGLKAFPGASNPKGLGGAQTMPHDGRISIMCYDSIQEKIFWIDPHRPFSPASSSSPTNWQWASPVISMGDEYAGFQFAGFQFEGSETGAQFTIYGGRDPYELASVDSGTITGLDNRVLFGKKLDFPFVGVVIGGSYRSAIGGVNLYMEGRGK